MRKPIDLTGRRFDRLVVIRRAANYNNGTSRWECMCDCGNKKIIAGNSLKSGKTRSCGCLRNEGNHLTHGMSNDRLYNIWRNMIQRCTDENSTSYKRYGGRGVTVCDQWRAQFEPFMEWSINSGYRDGLTLDRKDNDGPYSPDNCRWATQEEQQNNKRNNHMILFRGKSQTLQQWANETGIKAPTIRRRLKNGWPVEIALTKLPNQ